MSDQIKTQHGTIGLLMAECEQLRRDLAQAKAELGAWHSAFGTSQLSHALEAYEKAKAENARLEAEVKDLQSFNNDLCADLCAIEDSLGLKQDQFNADGSWKPTREAVKEKLRDLIAAAGELGDAKAENVRLAAAWVAFGNGRLQANFAECVRLSKVTLSDLLAPTIELLEQLTYPAVSAINNDIVHKELDRLRSILTSSSKSDTNTP